MFGINVFNAGLFRFVKANTVASNLTRVCICENMRPKCYKTVQEKQLFPGQEFSISVAAVGQLQSTTPGTVYADIRDEENQQTKFPKLHGFQEANLLSGSCTELSYTLLSENQRATLVLTIKPNLPAISNQDIEKVLDDTTGANTLSTWVPRFLVLPVHIAIAFKPCPLGFVLSEGSCNCTEVLQNTTCHVTLQLKQFTKTPTCG